MPEDTRIRLEKALGFKLISTERDVLTHLDTKECSLRPIPEIERPRVYDILESVADNKLRMVGYRTPPKQGE